jgi:predicted double-glycine peptidase
MTAGATNLQIRFAGSFLANAGNEIGRVSSFFRPVSRKPRPFSFLVSVGFAPYKKLSTGFKATMPAVGRALLQNGWQAGFLMLILSGPAFAAGHLPVRSILEFRRENVVIQKWDLSCGAAALATLLRYQFGENISEKKIARALMRRDEYVDHPELVRLQQGFSLLDLKRYVQSYATMTPALPRKKDAAYRRLVSKRSSNFRNTRHMFTGEGLGQLDIKDLIQRAPIMVPIDAFGYNHFVVFKGILGDRVLLADPAWGNRTMTIDKFERVWIKFAEPIGHVGFRIQRIDGRNPSNHLRPTPDQVLMFQ